MRKKLRKSEKNWNDERESVRKKKIKMRKQKVTTYDAKNSQEYGHTGFATNKKLDCGL
jgi:hypothetical protein